MTALHLDRIADALHPKTYLVRHDNGECFEVEALTIARARKLIEVECADRGWAVDDTETIEIHEKQVEAGNERRNSYIHN